MSTTSHLLEEALNGEQISLIEITSLIEKQSLSTSDMLYIAELDSKINLNIYEKYLIAVTSFYSCRYFRKDVEKAGLVLEELAEKYEDDFYLPATMLAVIKNDFDLLKKPRKKNEPLAILNIAKYFINNFGYRLALDKNKSFGPIQSVILGFGFCAPEPLFVQWVDYSFPGGFSSRRTTNFFSKKDIPSAAVDLRNSFELLSDFAKAYQLLKKTSYKSHADEIINSFFLDLVAFKEKYITNAPVSIDIDIYIPTGFKDLFGNEPLQYISGFFIALADFYKETNQLDNMFSCLHQAIDVNPELDYRLFYELVGEDITIDKVENYLDNFIQGLFYPLTMVEDITYDNESLNDMLFHMEKELKNCEYLVSAAENIEDFTPSDKENITLTLILCHSKFSQFKSKLEARKELPSIKKNLMGF